MVGTDVPDAIVVLAPVGVECEETAPLEVFVGQASTHGSPFAERPPAGSAGVDIYARESHWHTQTRQLLDDVPFALPLFEHDGAQAAAEMTIDAPKMGVLLLIADGEVAKPAAQVHVHAPDAVVERLSPVARRKRFELVLFPTLFPREFLEFRCDGDLMVSRNAALG